MDGRFIISRHEVAAWAHVGIASGCTNGKPTAGHGGGVPKLGALKSSGQALQNRIGLQGALAAGSGRVAPPPVCLLPGALVQDLGFLRQEIPGPHYYLGRIEVVRTSYTTPTFLPETGRLLLQL